MRNNGHEQYGSLRYWNKQYQPCFLQSTKQKKQKPVQTNSCAKYFSHKNKQTAKKSKMRQSSVSSSSQSSQNSLHNHKTNKHCCNKKKRLVEQQNQIQRSKNKNKYKTKQDKLRLNTSHSCGYKLSQCPLIQHYLNKISNRLKYQNQKHKHLQNQNKQLVKENKFFNQYYQTFQQRIKENVNQKHAKSKISIKCSKSLKNNLKQTDCCTFQKIAHSPINSKVKNPYEEGYQSDKYYQTDQPSQITRSSYHKNQLQNSRAKVKNFSNYYGHKF